MTQRLKFSFALTFFLLFLLGLRIFQLQILEGPAYTKIAKRQFLKQSKTEILRGEILDRNGNLLATSVPTFSLYIHPKETEKSEEELKFLCKQLDLSVEELKFKVASGANFIWLKRKLELSQAEPFLKNKFKGIGIVPEQIRTYPNGRMAAHLLGAVGMDNQALAGVEQAYDSFLKGIEIENSLLQDRRGRKIEMLSADSKKSNVEHDSLKQITLTIDRTLQYIAEKELERGMEEFKAGTGMVVIQNPNTGEILAMASTPAFDPNCFSRGQGKSHPSLIQNPVVSKMFEPGSTFKIVTFAAVMEAGASSSQEKFNCENGSWKIGARTIKDPTPNQHLTFSEIMEKSSNIGTAKIAQKIGKEELYRTARSFGFGTRTGIRLPGETAGKLTPPHQWTPFSLASISFGQEVGVTALQLLNAFSAIANGGNLLEPRIVKQLKEMREGNLTAHTFNPEIVRRVVSEKTAKELKRILRQAVESGTGIHAKVEGVSVAGKTGTAQKMDPKTKKYFTDRFLVSFCGFLPVEHPQLTCLVILDDVKKDAYGGTTAAPIFSRIMTQAVKIFAIPSDTPIPELAASPAGDKPHLNNPKAASLPEINKSGRSSSSTTNPKTVQLTKVGE